MPTIDRLEYVRSGKTAPLPRRGSVEAAGIDLGLPYNVQINPGGHVYLDLGIAFDIPRGHYMSVLPRSGNCDNKDSKGRPMSEHIIVLDNTVGVIDSDYTGNIKVKLTNNGNETYLGYCGEFIVQVVLKEYTEAKELVEVASITKQSVRGDSGFGSSDEPKS